MDTNRLNNQLVRVIGEGRDGARLRERFDNPIIGGGLAIKTISLNVVTDPEPAHGSFARLRRPAGCRTPT